MRVDILTKKNLEYWLSLGILDLCDLVASEREVLMTKILENSHKSKITQTTDGRWITRVPDPDRPKGRMVRKKSKEDLLAYLIQFYGYVPDNVVIAFVDLYKEWVEYEREFTKASYKPKSPSTIRRYERDYARFIEGTPLEAEPITITDFDLEKHMIKIIKNTKMIESAFSNFYDDINMAYRYAVRKRLVASNPMDFLDKERLRSFCVPSKKAKDKDRVLSLDELKALKSAIYTHSDRHPKYMPDYGILLACMTGMRVSEISALHWSDIDDECIHIDYSEHRNDYADHIELVIGEPKNGKHRSIPMTDEMRELFDIVRDLEVHYEDYVFCTPDKRYTSHDISCACDRRAKEAGLGGASIHKIRRSVSSYLNTIISREAVANLLGHLPETNAQYYDYDISSMAEKREALETMSHSVTLLDFCAYNKKKEKAQ